MKILFVSEYYYPHIGGAETVFKNLAERLAKLGHQCQIVTSRLPDTPKQENINNVEIYRINVPNRGGRYWFSLLAIPKIIKIARRADIIHTTTYNAAFPAWLAAKLTKTKNIITIHEVWKDLWLKLPKMNIFTARIYRFTENLLLRLPFNVTICVSNYTYKCIKNFNSKKSNLKVIYNGIDNNLFATNKIKPTRRELNLPQNSFIYMYYGRPGVSKGVEYLIQAVSLISDMIPNSKLLLILSRQPENRYKKILEMLKSLKIDDTVILLNPVTDNVLIDYISTSNCVVIPSLSEGFGFATAEACTMGKPVVASNTASLPEVVSGEYVLVEPGNPKSIADGVIRIFNGDTEKSERKVFDWDKCVSQYVDVYRMVLTGT